VRAASLCWAAAKSCWQRQLAERSQRHVTRLVRQPDLLGIERQPVTLDGANETISGINIADSFGTAITLGTNDTLSNINIDTSAGTGDGIENNGAIGALTMSNIVVTTGSGTGIALVGAAAAVPMPRCRRYHRLRQHRQFQHRNSARRRAHEHRLRQPDLPIDQRRQRHHRIDRDGIILDTTGLGGGLIVTGDAAHGAGSGGTIQNMTGTAGSTTNGIGIYLHSTANVSLSDMQLNDFATTPSWATASPTSRSTIRLSVRPHPT